MTAYTVDKKTPASLLDLDPYFFLSLSCCGHASGSPVSTFSFSLQTCYLFTTALDVCLHTAHFIPHLSSTTCDHRIITPAHKVWLISPIIVRITDQRGVIGKGYERLPSQRKAKRWHHFSVCGFSLFGWIVLGSNYSYASARVSYRSSQVRSVRGREYFLFIFLDSFQCQYVPAETLISMEMLFDIDSLVIVTVL